MALVKKFKSYKDVKISELPSKLRTNIKDAHDIVVNNMEKVFKSKADLKNDPNIIEFKKNFIKNIPDSNKRVRLYNIGNGKYDCMIQLMNHVKVPSDQETATKIRDFVANVYKKSSPQVKAKVHCRLDDESKDPRSNFEGFDIYPDPKTSKIAWNSLENKKVLKESDDGTQDLANSIVISTWLSQQYANGITEAEKKFAILGERLLKDGKVDNSFMTILNNEIKEEFIGKTSSKKIVSKYDNQINKKEFKLSLSEKKGKLFEFECKPPTEEILQKLLNGRGELHEFIMESNAKMKISKELLLSIKEKRDLYDFFELAFYYYRYSLKDICKMIKKNFINLDRTTKQLISDTDMKSIFTLVLHQALVFEGDDISLGGRNIFHQAKKDTEKTIKWAVGLLNKLKANKKEVMDEINSTIKSYKESIDYSPIYMDIIHLDQTIEKFYNGQYNNVIQKCKDRLYSECVNHRDSEKFDIRIMVEKYGLSRLKSIDKNIISDFKEQLKSDKDQLEIAADLIPYIERVNWYLDILDKNTPRYIINQPKKELDQIQSDLYSLYKESLDIKSDKQIKINGIEF